MEKKALKIALILFLITAMSKVFGFGREILTGYFLGANGVSDAYNLSLLIPNFFALIIQQTISLAFVPIYIKILTDSGKKDADSFATKILIIITFVFLILSTFIFFFSDLLVTAFGSGLQDNSKQLASTMLKIGAWSLILQGFVLVFSARLQALKHFILPAITGFALDTACLCFLLLANKVDNYSLLGFIPVLSLVLQCIMLIPFSIKKGISIKKIGILFDQNIKKVFKIIIPAIFAVGIYQINVLVDKNIASNIVEGGISSLNYSQNILNLFQALMINALITPFYSSISESSAKKDEEKISDLLSSHIKLIVLLLLPVSMILFTYSEEIVTVIYSRGAFDSTAVKLTSECLKGYSFSLVFVVLNTLLTKYMYSVNKQKEAIFFSAISLIINVGLNLFIYFLTPFGIGGIAWATFVSTISNTILLLVYIKKTSNYNLGINSLIKITFHTFLSFVFSLAAKNGFNNLVSNRILVTVVGLSSFLICYIVAILSSDKELFESLKRFLKNTFTKRIKTKDIE